MATVEFLGRLSDNCGPTQEITLPASLTNITALRDYLNAQLDGAPLTSATIRAIVNGKVATDTQTITNEDTIAFFPPVGGG
ncbi:MAG: MoaD/ThiS family protein [Maricaulaceae bacterium]